MTKRKYNKQYWRLKRKQRKQIVILLGAGAAMPWDGVRCEEIKQDFINDESYKIGGVNLAQRIFDILDAYYSPNQTNFETFLAVIETILSYIISSTNIGRNVLNSSFTPSIFDFKELIAEMFQGKNDDEKREYIFEIHRHYLTKLIEKIDLYNCNICDEKHLEKNENLKAFIRFYLSKGYSVKFYTTNYDDLVSEIVKSEIPIYCGLRKYNNDLQSLIDKNLENYRLAKLSFINIHGSIFNQLTFDMNKAKYVHVKHKILPNFLTYAQAHEGGNPNEPLIYSPIITGYNKTQRAFSEPFNIFFNAFANDCNDCVGLITVGYSFSDPHINSILSSLTTWNKCKFINVTSTDDRYKTGAEFHRLDYEVSPFYIKSEDDIWITDINQRKYIYKKGFEKFLENKDNWKLVLS